MSLGLPVVQLKEAEKGKLKVKKFILCQRVKDSRSNKSFTSTENSQKTLVKCLKVLNKGLVCGIEDKHRSNTMLLSAI